MTHTMQTMIIFGKQKALLLTCMVFMLTGSLFAQLRGMKSYKNEKYEYSINVPKTFNGMGESTSGDGQTFVSPEGDIHVQVYGGYNAQNLFGTSMDDEFNGKLNALRDRKVEILDFGTEDDPDGEFDEGYEIQYVEDGLFHFLRTVWWDERYATVLFWCYKDDKDKLNEDEPYIDRIVYSLGPDDGIRITEAEEVLGWYHGEGWTHVYKSGAKPNISDFFTGFATSYQTPLTMLALELINNPKLFDENDEIDEWVVDKKNGYIKLGMVGEEPYWLEACYWNCDNGHQLFVVNYNAPNQVLLPFDYDPAENVLNPAPETFKMLVDKTSLVAELPRQGKNITLHPVGNSQKTTGQLNWNGKGFSFVKN